MILGNQAICGGAKCFVGCYGMISGAGRKFDIRLWVLVTSMTPLVVWEFSECYLRFSSHQFNGADVEDPLIHLCNYSVQKDNPGKSE